MAPAGTSKETGQSATLWRARESDWRGAAEAVLGERSVESLVAQTDDGLAVGPIYRPAENGTAVWQRAARRPWIVVQRIDDPDEGRARKTVSAALAGGATGIELVFDGSASAARAGFGLNSAENGLLAGLPDSRSVQVRLDVDAAAYQHYRRINTTAVNELIVSFDPLADAAARGGFDRPLAEIEGTVLRAARDFRDSGLNGCPVVADGRIWAAGGASEAQEIAGILGSMVHSLRLLIGGGFSAGQGLEVIGLVVDAGANQLLTIAKLRALRLCHARIVEAFGSGPIHARLHAETSSRMMTRYDVHTNLLRSTSAAFAAGIAGADSITVLPCTIAVGIPDAFARRMAGNTQMILLEESGLARIDDPGAGAGAVESLTEAIAEAAWTEFRRLEAAGGLAAALRSGTFQTKIANTRRTRTEKIAHRQSAITGVSHFPAVGQRDIGGVAAPLPVPQPLPPNVETIPPLQAVRFAEPYESLRDRATELAAAGKPPKLFLVNFGPAAESAGLARYAANFFAVGGLVVVDSGDVDTPEEAVRAFSISGANAACITGSTDMLRGHATATAKSLKESGAQRVYLVGASEAGDAIDAVLDDASDIIEILTDCLALHDNGNVTRGTLGY